MFKRAGEKAAGAAGRVEEGFAEARVGLVDHELGDGAWRVELAGVARALQVLEDFFVEVVEEVAFLLVVEVDLVDLVDHLAQELAGLHVVKGVLEHGLDDGGARVAGEVGVESLERGEEAVVDEFEQRVAGQPFGIRRPVAPAQGVGDRRDVVVAQDFEFGFLIVENLEKEQPADL